MATINASIAAEAIAFNISPQPDLVPVAKIVFSAMLCTEKTEEGTCGGSDTQKTC